MLETGVQSQGVGHVTSFGGPEGDPFPLGFWRLACKLRRPSAGRRIAPASALIFSVSLPSVSLSRFPLFRGTQWYWMRAYPNDLILAYHSCTDPFLIRSHCEVLGARTSASFWRHTIQPLTVTYNDGEERACGDTRGIASHWPTRLGSPRREMAEERKQDPHLEGP